MYVLCFISNLHCILDAVADITVTLLRILSGTQFSLILIPLPLAAPAPAEPNYWSTTQSFSKHARVSPRKGRVGPSTTTGSSIGSKGSTVQKDKVHATGLT